MTFSCTSSLLTAAGARTFHDAVDMAARLGFNGLCLECDADGLVPAASFSFRASGEMVRYALQQAIEIHCLVGDGWSGGAPDDAAFGLKRLVCMAHALACPLVAVQAPPLDGTVALEPQYERAIGALQDAVELATELDVCLAIAPEAGSLAVNADEAMDMVDDTDRRNIGIVFNPGYLAASGGETPEKAVEILKDYLLLVQLRGATALAIAQHEFDAALAALKAIEYRQYVMDCTPGVPGASAKDVQKLLRTNLACLRTFQTPQEKGA